MSSPPDLLRPRRRILPWDDRADRARVPGAPRRVRFESRAARLCDGSATMIAVACPYCGQTGTDHPLWALPDRLWFPDRSFTLVRCKVCRFVYLNPRPDGREIEEYYPESAHDGWRFPDRIPPAFLWRLGEIEARVRRGRLLDVGCGNGVLLAFAVERGWDGYGVDAVPGAVRVARQR